MGGLEITQLARNPYSLGMAARFLSEHRPFADMEFGSAIQSLMFQIHEGTHLIASRGDALVGYLGWLRVDPACAEDWQAGRGRLVAKRDGAAVAVTLFATDLPDDILPMIRAAKALEPGRSVYWKRYFVDGRAPSARQVAARQVAARQVKVQE
jgi:hypothetical protein